ncbi:uncharacterized protein LOC117316422 [Pecten maximus]|uniref:uncharacterized protein LOC117316422 n=1 Tax=Pecten maximus TaxID=6579 RepID=UPI001459073B|nr:uncharacterized protein LOC117316422 [Pecten maximus]
MKSDSKSMTLETSVGSVPKRPAYTRHSTKTGPRRQWLGARRRISSVSFDIKPIKENSLEDNVISLGGNKEYNYRRMSAPELPPIDYRTKYSPTQLVLQGSLLRRTSYNGNSGSHPHSATSDGSLRGQTAKSPLSANSSSSGQSLGQQGKSVGLNRGKTWCVPEQTDVGSPRTDQGKRKPVGSTHNQMTPRSTRFRTSRLSSKENSLSSGNNNTTSNRRPLQHCKSDSKIISPIEEFQKSKTFIKRNNSEQKLNDKNAKNNQRTLSIDKTENLTRNKTTAGNVSGMRRYSSTYVLNFNNKSSENESRTTTEQENDDSDSDSNKDQYIINWIIGVQSEEREIPPEPEIEYHDVPPQTDTAVHIVYGDS